MGQIPSISQPTGSVFSSGVETERFAGACNTRLAGVDQFSADYSSVCDAIFAGV